MKKRYWVIFWLAAVLLLYYLNGTLPLTDSVEGNYALTAKEMVVSGDFLSPQIYGRYWFDKPVFAYWMIALGFKLFWIYGIWGSFFPFSLWSFGPLSGDLGQQETLRGKSGILQWCLSAHDASIFLPFRSRSLQMACSSYF